MFTPSLPSRHNVWKADTVPTVPRDHVGPAKLLTTVTALPLCLSHIRHTDLCIE